MDTEERVLTALRCEEPDRVPIFIYLNPYIGSARDKSYNQLLDATREYADVIRFYAAACISREYRISSRRRLSGCPSFSRYWICSKVSLVIGDSGLT